MTLQNRLAQLEKRRDEQPSTPKILEVWGMRMDGTTYLIETWKQLIDADARGDLANCPQWERFINDESPQPINPA